MTDRRRRQYVPRDVDFLQEDGYLLYQRFGWAGIVAFEAFLSACQTSTEQGCMLWREQDDARVKMGLQGDYALPFTLAEFFAWTGEQRKGRRRWTTTTTRHGVHKTVDNFWGERQPRRHIGNLTPVSEGSRRVLGGLREGSRDIPEGSSQGLSTTLEGSSHPQNSRSHPKNTAHIRRGSGAEAAQKRRNNGSDTAPPSPHLTSPTPDVVRGVGEGGDAPRARASADGSASRPSASRGQAATSSLERQEGSGPDGSRPAGGHEPAAGAGEPAAGPPCGKHRVPGCVVCDPTPPAGMSEQARAALAEARATLGMGPATGAARNGPAHGLELEHLARITNRTVEELLHPPYLRPPAGEQADGGQDPAAGDPA